MNPINQISYLAIGYTFISMLMLTAAVLSRFSNLRNERATLMAVLYVEFWKLYSIASGIICLFWFVVWVMIRFTPVSGMS